MASARARSWSIGSPSLWIVIFCSTLVSTTPSFSVLYCGKCGWRLAILSLFIWEVFFFVFDRACLELILCIVDTDFFLTNVKIDCFVNPVTMIT